ncbi:hypothetical protein HAX54_043198 [Datura stramonium]|uniref:Uncharacterized protein n=1 Tax=Datura stramonium TaxID=4076 RepID=A0ABS8Y8K2_DATST|nr:hypothetical protein [Datura stramonium]
MEAAAGVFTISCLLIGGFSSSRGRNRWWSGEGEDGFGLWCSVISRSEAMVEKEIVVDTGDVVSDGVCVRGEESGGTGGRRRSQLSDGCERRGENRGEKGRGREFRRLPEVMVVRL